MVCLRLSDVSEQGPVSRRDMCTTSTSYSTRVASSQKGIRVLEYSEYIYDVIIIVETRYSGYSFTVVFAVM
jgi:hypothetical protein